MWSYFGCNHIYVIKEETLKDVFGGLKFPLGHLSDFFLGGFFIVLDQFFEEEVESVNFVVRL
jgi:hypothetical protein